MKYLDVNNVELKNGDKIAVSGEIYTVESIDMEPFQVHVRGNDGYETILFLFGGEFEIITDVENKQYIKLPFGTKVKLIKSSGNDIRVGKGVIIQANKNTRGKYRYIIVTEVLISDVYGPIIHPNMVVDVDFEVIK